jgi:membrane protease YdiL (CAAX protease family)
LAHLAGGEGGSTIWIAAIDTFILGMVLAYLRERSGSLWPSIGLHASKNMIAFLFLFVFKIA